MWFRKSNKVAVWVVGLLSVSDTKDSTTFRTYSLYVCSEATTLGPKKKWSLNRGGLLIEVKMHGKATIGTRPSGP